MDCTCRNLNFLKYIKELIEELKRSETVLFLDHYNFIKQAYITLKNNNCHSELVWQSEPKFLSSWTCFRILKSLCEPVLTKCRILPTWSFCFQLVRSRNKFGMTYYFFSLLLKIYYYKKDSRKKESLFGRYVSKLELFEVYQRVDRITQKVWNSLIFRAL